MYSGSSLIRLNRLKQWQSAVVAQSFLLCEIFIADVPELVSFRHAGVGYMAKGQIAWDLNQYQEKFTQGFFMRFILS